MKKVFLSILVIIISIIIFSCGKDKISKDPHNYSLLNKSLDEIKSEIKGKWRIQRFEREICGVIGCNRSQFVYPTNKGDVIQFAANDTIVRTNFDMSTTYLYEKSEVIKIKNWSFGASLDSIYMYSMQLGSIYYIMTDIKNDTLVIDNGYASRSGSKYYLTKIK